MPAKKKIDTGRYSKFLIYLVVIVLLNVAGITLFFRLDLTSQKIYSLSEASKKVVSTLSEPLTVKVFFNSNLPAPYNNVERYLHDLLEEYAVAGGRHFNYQFYNVSGEENDESGKNQDIAKSYGVYPVQIQNIEQDEVKFQKAYMGMALIHGDIIEPIPTITSTDGLEYKITSSIRKMNNKISALLRLEDKVSVKLVLSSSLKVVGPYMNISGLTSLPGKIEGIVNKLNDKNYGKLSFEYLDPTINPDDEKQAMKYKIILLNWDGFKDRRGKAISADRGYAGIVVEHGDNSESLELIEVIRLPIFGTQYQLADLSGLEDAINETIENVIDINEGIGYLADHGTLTISGGMPPMFAGMQQQDSISSLNTLLSGEYSIKQVSLKDGGIPDGISTLIIAGAKENFTDYELYQIDQFLMKGKSLAVFMDSFNEVKPRQGQQPMMNQLQRSFWMPLNTGLEKLLNNYGLSVRKSIVMDENSYKQRMPRQLGGGERNIYFAPIIKNEKISKDAEYMENIKGLVLLKSSPVEVDEQKIRDNELHADRLLSSSDRSWEMAGRVNLDPTYIRPPHGADKFRSFPMAYVVEGSFPGYFAGKDIPEKNVPEKAEGAEIKEEDKEKTEDPGIDMSAIKSESATLTKSKPAKIFLVGTSEILKDNIVDAEGKTPNAQFIMNMIDYLNGRGDIAVMRSKTQRFNPLHDLTPASKTAIKTVNIAGLPVLVVIAGVIVWGRRSARKRMIQKIFSR
ncbi:MAG: Gldg family protein [Nitrospirota bacterium]